MLANVEEIHRGQGAKCDRTDGPGVNLANWCFNLRASNTEPLVRPNVETRGDAKLLEAKTDEVLGLMGQC